MNKLQSKSPISKRSGNRYRQMDLNSYASPDRFDLPVKNNLMDADIARDLSLPPIGYKNLSSQKHH